MSLLNGMKAVASESYWRRFVDIYQPLLDTWLRRQGIPPAMADDVRQDVLVKVHQEIATFRHNGRTGAFRAWLRAILAHRLRTTLRREWREPHPVDEALVEQLAQEDSIMTRQWNAEHDAFVIDRLLELVAGEFQPQTLQAFRRIVLDNDHVVQVAEELRMSPNAVRIAQSRVLAALRRVGEGLVF